MLTLRAKGVPIQKIKSPEDFPRGSRCGGLQLPDSGETSASRDHSGQGNKRPPIRTRSNDSIQSTNRFFRSLGRGPAGGTTRRKQAGLLRGPAGHELRGERAGGGRRPRMGPPTNANTAAGPNLARIERNRQSPSLRTRLTRWTGGEADRCFSGGLTGRRKLRQRQESAPVSHTVSAGSHHGPTCD